MSISILEDLYRYNHWANWKVLELCDGLTEEQLDQPREIGFGSLRNTLFHILTAEEIWLERWIKAPRRPFPIDAQGMSPVQLGERLDSANQRRADWMDAIGEEGLITSCTYQDSKGTTHTNPFKELLVHVANHGIHHRAQALNFLKSFGRTRRGGLDYLFFRFANPCIEQTSAAVEALQQFGLDYRTGESLALQFDRSLIQRFLAYGDWANRKLIELWQSLSDDKLDRDFGMGMGTIRKTILHVFDAEQFWTKNWTMGESNFNHLSPTTSLAELQEHWSANVDIRNQFIAEQDDVSVSRILSASFGGPAFQVPMIESMVQVCGHGTHHRAQLINMLRHSDLHPPAIDYLLWVREADS